MYPGKEYQLRQSAGVPDAQKITQQEKPSDRATSARRGIRGLLASQYGLLQLDASDYDRTLKP